MSTPRTPRTRSKRREISASHQANWKATLMSAVSGRTQARRHGQVYIAAYVWPAFVDLLDRAALTRGVSRSVYLRRAVAVLVAADLGIDVREVLGHTAHPDTGWNRAPRVRAEDGRYVPVFDNGVGIQTWCPHPNCTGAHL